MRGLRLRVVGDGAWTTLYRYGAILPRKPPDPLCLSFWLSVDDLAYIFEKHEKMQWVSR